jgi:hypothetical protein
MARSALLAASLVATAITGVESSLPLMQLNPSGGLSTDMDDGVAFFAGYDLQMRRGGFYSEFCRVYPTPDPALTQRVDSSFFLTIGVVPYSIQRQRAQRRGLGRVLREVRSVR